MNKGFSLVELIIVMMIFALLIGFVSFNLLGGQHRASLDGAVEVLISDLRSQQLKATNGNSEGEGWSAAGVYFTSSQYTLFHGSTYLSSDPANFIVKLDNTLVLANTFSGNQVVFSQVSGEIAGFANGANTITITDKLSNQSKVITLNKYGTVISVN